MSKIQVRATVGPKTLANVDRYFTNTLDGIVVELLQNCRRAGASLVDVTVDRSSGEVTVADDGRGIPVEQASLLLSFGGSCNEEVVESDEAPAGMGFFSLARRGARVRSEDWEMTVRPAAFTGSVPAELRTGLPSVRGTAVTFMEVTADEGIGWDKLAVALIKETCRGMPFACRVDGETVERRTPADALRALVEATQAAGLVAEVAEAFVGDCQVVVARVEDGGKFDKVLSIDREGQSTWMEADVFGQVIPFDAPTICQMLGFGNAAHIEADLVVQTGVAWRWVQPRYAVALVAVGSMTLVPRLPDRKSLVSTEGLDAVADTVRGLMASLALQAPRNGVNEHHWMRWVQQKHGLRLRQLVLEAPVRSTSAGYVPLVVAAYDDGQASEASMPAGAAVVAAPTPLIENLLFEAVRRSRKGSAMGKILVARHRVNPKDAVCDLVETIELWDGDRWFLVAENGQMDDDALRYAEWPENKSRVVKVDALRLRLLTERGRTIVGSLDHACLDAVEGPILVTDRADAPVVATLSRDLHAWDKFEEEPELAAAKHYNDILRLVGRATKGEAAHLARQVALAVRETDAASGVASVTVEIRGVGDERRCVVIVSMANGGSATVEVDDD